VPGPIICSWLCKYEEIRPGVPHDSAHERLQPHTSRAGALYGGKPSANRSGFTTDPYQKVLAQLTYDMWRRGAAWVVDTGPTFPKDGRRPGRAIDFFHGKTRRRANLDIGNEIDRLTIAWPGPGRLAYKVWGQLKIPRIAAMPRARRWARNFDIREFPRCGLLSHPERVPLLRCWIATVRATWDGRPSIDKGAFATD